MISDITHCKFFGGGFDEVDSTGLEPTSFWVIVFEQVKNLYKRNLFCRKQGLNLQFKADFQALRPLRPTVLKKPLNPIFYHLRVDLLLVWFQTHKKFFWPKKSFRPLPNLKEMSKSSNICNLFISQCVHCKCKNCNYSVLQLSFQLLVVEPLTSERCTSTTRCNGSNFQQLKRQLEYSWDYEPRLKTRIVTVSHLQCVDPSKKIFIKKLFVKLQETSKRLS